jgi:hypothetical protein
VIRLYCISWVSCALCSSLVYGLLSVQCLLLYNHKRLFYSKFSQSMSPLSVAQVWVPIKATVLSLHYAFPEAVHMMASGVLQSEYTKWSFPLILHDLLSSACNMDSLMWDIVVITRTLSSLSCYAGRMLSTGRTWGTSVQHWCWQPMTNTGTNHGSGSFISAEG